MAIFTYSKKGESTFFHSVKIAFSFFLFFLSSFMVKAQQVNGVITDFSGYWRSDSAALNSVNPNTSHNVVAFKVGSTIYSTGVNNTLLSNKSIPYTSGNFKALPINSITGTVPGPPIYIALPGEYDGVSAGFSSPLPTVKMKDVITDGINGLDIGTGVTNIPASAVMTFPVQSIDIASINDAKPDVLYTQIADPSSVLDTIYFVNASGVTIGRRVTVNWSSVPSLGTYILDLYNLRVGASCDTASIISGFNSNTTRNIRLTSFKLSDFGITSANAASVKFLIVRPGGDSDPAFMAYNTDAFVITPPAITSQPQTKVVCAGTNQSATFSVTATGTGDTYQWMKNGVNIAGATGSTYTINPVTANDAGTYEVVVTNSGGTVTSNKAYLNTAITRQPSTSYQTIVTGNTVTLSVSATNASSFQWKKNGVNITGATDSIYKINSLNRADSGIYTVSAINATNSCANIISNPDTLKTAIVVYSNSAGNINQPATWGANTDGSGSTPVDFTRGEHTFVLSNRALGNTLTNLTIAGTLDVKNGVAIIADSTTLDVGSCIRSGTGSISGSTSAGLTVRGNSFLYFTSGNQVLKNFTVAGGTVTMLSSLAISGGSVPGKLNLTGGTLALDTTKITIRSTSPTNTSMVTAVGSGAAITYRAGGAFVIEKYVPARRSFRFISPAVTTTTNIKRNWMEGVVNPDRWNNINPLPGYGTHITGPRTAADSLDVTQTYNPSLFTFDPIRQTWNAVPNSAGTLTAGSPFRFMIRGSRSVDLNNNDAVPSNTILRTTGTLTTGTYNVSSAILSSTVGTYSFIGNPYASPVDWNALTKSGVSSSYYAWDEKFNIRGTYIAYNGAAGTNSNSASEVDENIQSQQAVLVLTTAANPTVQFNEVNKTSVNNRVFKTSNTQTKLSVQLLLNENGGPSNSADGFVAVYGDDFSKNICDEDSYKFTNLDENIAINRNGTLLSIEGRPYVNSGDTLPIKMWQFRQRNYFLKIDGKNFSPTLNATLKDNFLQQETSLDLASSTITPFSITDDSASFAPGRFAILFETYATLPLTLTSAKAYRKEKGIQVDWRTATETNIEKYEVEKSTDLRHFDSVYATPAGSNISGNSYSWFDESANDGDNFYRIKIIDKTGGITYSPVLRVSINSSKGNFTIFPNPVTGNTISLQMVNMAEGTYSVNIFNNAGQKVYSSAMQFAGRSATQAIELKQKIAPGKYTLQLANDKLALTRPLLVK